MHFLYFRILDRYVTLRIYSLRFIEQNLPLLTDGMDKFSLYDAHTIYRISVRPSLCPSITRCSVVEVAA